MLDFLCVLCGSNAFKFAWLDRLVGCNVRIGTSWRVDRFRGQGAPTTTYWNISRRRNAEIGTEAPSDGTDLGVTAH